MQIKEFHKIKKESKVRIKNMILISGDGRNVGKTFLSCALIKQLKSKQNIIAIKSSPHFHALNENDEILYKHDDYIIVKEVRHSNKDSSLMLQAGAQEVFFIMANDEGLKMAFSLLMPFLNGNIIIAESGALHEFIDPGIFLFLKKEGKEISKTQYLNYSPELITRSENNYEPSIPQIMDLISQNILKKDLCTKAE